MFFTNSSAGLQATTLHTIYLVGLGVPVNAVFHVHTQQDLRNVGPLGKYAAHTPGQPHGDGLVPRGKARHETANEVGRRIHGRGHVSQIFVSPPSSQELLSQAPRIVARRFWQECLTAGGRSVYHWNMKLLT